MAVVKISDPNGADMYAQNGWFHWTTQKLVIDRINRDRKITIDPKAANSSVNETDNDITIIIGADVLAAIGTGLPAVPDPTKSYVLVNVANAGVQWFEATVDSESVFTVTPEGGFGWEKIVSC